MAAILRVYQRSFDHRPNTTLALTGGTLNATGDVIAQLLQIRASSSLLPTSVPRQYPLTG